MSSHISLSDIIQFPAPGLWSILSHCWSFWLIGVYHTQFSVAWFLVSAFMSKMFDVGDLPVLTVGNCALKTGLWNYTYVFFTFLRFFKIQKRDLLRFLSCCTRFLEHWTGPVTAAVVHLVTVHRQRYPSCHAADWLHSLCVCYRYVDSTKSLKYLYFGRLFYVVFEFDWTDVATVFSTGIWKSSGGTSCPIIQSYSPGGANNTRTGESRWDLPRISSLVSYCIWYCTKHYCCS